MSILKLVRDNLNVIVLLIPAGFVLWEAGFLHVTGSRRHWRRFGIGLYVSGFSLALGSCTILKGQTGEAAIAAFIIFLVMGAMLPFLALSVTENELGNLVHPSGVKVSRIAGVFVYFFSMYLIFDMAR